MAGVPQNFQSISNVIPTYQFIDIASGTGFITFYGGTTVDDQILSNFTYYSDAVYTTANNSNPPTNDYAIVTDIDFDVLLNRPMNIAGQGIVNVPFGIQNPSNTCQGYVSVSLSKWDGANETVIVTNTGTIKSKTVGASIGYFMSSIDLTIPLTHFKIGETLRLTVQVYAYGNSGTTTAYCGHDPKARTTGWDTTAAVSSQLTFQCPVRLNL